MTINIKKSIFKAYDIRGVYPNEINPEVAYIVGAAYATFLKSENPNQSLKVIVGRDMRSSSEVLGSQLVAGLTNMGVEVINIGLCTTPAMYFAVGSRNCDGGVMITASHNPAEYNGFKLVRSKARPIGEGNGMEEVAEIALKQQFEKTQIPGSMQTDVTVLTDLARYSIGLVDINNIKPLTVVVDAANAVGALEINEVFKHLPIKLIPLYFELDGTFPNHPADPLNPDNLKDLQAAISKHHADLGIALDGDGDRIFLVDDEGEEIPQAILRGLMAQIELNQSPNSVVCYDIRPGRITQDMIDEVGGRAVITRVGHSLIKQTMLEHDAVFGGESSGHYFYQTKFGTFEMPSLLTVKFLEHLSQSGRTASELVAPYKRYAHSGEINNQVDDKEAVLVKIKDHYADADISELDGITVTYDDYWFNVRASNTEPKLRLNLEAKTQELMEQKREEVLALIRS